MTQLELLAPARDMNIGIAAIDCGADAVYIAGPQFGARQAAGNSVEDIRKLCDYAHLFGARIFITLNTILYDNELQDAYKFMLDVEDAGADAIIVQDLAVVEMARKGVGEHKRSLNIPLHASTQCAVRTPEQAVFLESLGFSRLILERELSIEQIRKIRAAVSCELEFFVHGALCVCYSGQCYLSEYITGRSANRGSCIQACRSKYDLRDENSRLIAKDKCLLSLKDYNLKERMGELAEAGINSFKIEGRLKNASYVKNVVRDYSLTLDRLIENNEEKYERASHGIVSEGFSPDLVKTFNRDYTELFIDGRRGKWASLDAAKSMGERIGVVQKVNNVKGIVEVNLFKRDTVLNNGDGFSFVTINGDVSGFRGDICCGNQIKCKAVPELKVGMDLYRNTDASFEKEIERKPCKRLIRIDVGLHFKEDEILAEALCEDGRKAQVSFPSPSETAENQERIHALIENQINKRTDIFRFTLRNLCSDEKLPLISASSINNIRRRLAEEIASQKCICKPMKKNHKFAPLLATEELTYKANIANHLAESAYKAAGAKKTDRAFELTHTENAELMRTKYCIRYELGLCPKQSSGNKARPLFLINNGQKFELNFDCKNCEMTLTSVQK